MWLVIAVLAFASLLALHFRWRCRSLHHRKQLETEIKTLRQEREQQGLEIENQQQALLNSMVEGVAVLDENGCITLANRAFTTLFQVGDVRGKTIMEALRLHELAATLGFLHKWQAQLQEQLVTLAF